MCQSALCRIFIAYINSFHAAAPAGAGVNGEQHRFHFGGAVCPLVSACEIAPEFGDGKLRTDAQHRMHGAGHAQIRHIASALGQDLGIRPELSIQKFRGDLTERYRWADGPTKMEAVLFTIDSATGKCLKAERVDEWD